MKKLTELFAVLIFLISSSAWCEKITFSANKMSGVAGNKNSMTTLKGNAKVKTSSMDITADYIELSGKDFRMIKAEGNVTGKNTESHLDFTCGKLLYDRETKIATLENNVKLTDLDNDVVAQAQVIEYNQDSEIAVMQIEINLTQKDNVCTSAYAIYKKNEQILEMSGNPKIVQKGDTFRAQAIVLDMNSQEITLSGRVKGSVVTESKKDEENSEEAVASQKPETSGETEKNKEAPEGKVPEKPEDKNADKKTGETNE